MHGPWQIGNNNGDVVRENGSSGQINHEIAIIVPAAKIMEIISQSGWVRTRMTIVVEEHKKVSVENYPFALQDSLEGVGNKSS